MNLAIIFAGISAIVALLGLMGSFIGVLIKLNKTLVRLTVTSESLERTITTMETGNEKRDEKLSNHETRITILEHDNEPKGKGGK